MKKLLFSLLFIYSTAFAGGYSYKVTEFVMIKDANTGKITSALMTVSCERDGKIFSDSMPLTKEEIAACEKDASNEKAVAKRIALGAKRVLDMKIAEDKPVIVEKYDQTKLDAIAIDAAKVK